MGPSKKGQEGWRLTRVPARPRASTSSEHRPCLTSLQAKPLQAPPQQGRPPLLGTASPCPAPSSPRRSILDLTGHAQVTGPAPLPGAGGRQICPPWSLSREQCSASRFQGPARVGAPGRAGVPTLCGQSRGPGTTWQRGGESDVGKETPALGPEPERSTGSALGAALIMCGT